MNASTTQTSRPNAADEDAIPAIHQQLIDAWNTSSDVAFAASFTHDADFVAFDGTHLPGVRNSPCSISRPSTRS